MIVTTKELFKLAYGSYALGAYNINNLEQTVGLFRGNLGKSAKNEDPADASKSVTATGCTNVSSTARSPKPRAAATALAAHASEKA